MKKNKPLLCCSLSIAILAAVGDRAHADRAYAIGCDPISIHNGRMRDPKFRHAYENYARSHRGTNQQVREGFNNLHPFVRANYGSQVILVGASASTATGTVTTTSGGVVANDRLNASLTGKAPMPISAVKSPVATAKSRTLSSLCAGAATCELMSVLAAAVPRGTDHANRLAGVQRMLGATGFADKMQFTVQQPNEIALRGQSAACDVQLTYRPGDGISVRSTEMARGGKGYQLFLKSSNGQLRLGSAYLRDEAAAPQLRHIPLNSRTTAVARPAALQAAEWGL